MQRVRDTESKAALAYYLGVQIKHQASHQTVKMPLPAAALAVGHSRGTTSLTAPQDVPGPRTALLLLAYQVHCQKSPKFLEKI